MGAGLLGRRLCALKPHGVNVADGRTTGMGVLCRRKTNKYGLTVYMVTVPVTKASAVTNSFFGLKVQSDITFLESQVSL
jgi:hypothetical protein